jgi:hypothetical protein
LDAAKRGAEVDQELRQQLLVPARVSVSAWHCSITSRLWGNEKGRAQASLLFPVEARLAAFLRFIFSQQETGQAPSLHQHIRRPRDACRATTNSLRHGCVVHRCRTRPDSALQSIVCRRPAGGCPQCKARGTHDADARPRRVQKFPDPTLPLRRDAGLPRDIPLGTCEPNERN